MARRCRRTPGGRRPRPRPPTTPCAALATGRRRRRVTAHRRCAGRGSPRATTPCARGARRRVRSATALARRRPTPPTRPRDPGLAKGARDLELPPVEQGPLRHRDRAGGARGAADRRPRHRRRHRRHRRRPGRGRRDHRARGRRRRRSRASRSRRPTSCARRSRTASGARCTSPRRSAAPRSRATSTSCTDDPDGLVVVDYKTDAVAPTTPTSTPRWRATGSRARRTRSRSNRRPASRWRSACSCSSASDGAHRTSVSDLPAAMREVRAALAASFEPPPHQDTTDRAGEHHQRGVAPRPPDVGADDHRHGDERHPDQTVEEADDGLDPVVRRDTIQK